jgi:hypothetical protein
VRLRALLAGRGRGGRGDGGRGGALGGGQAPDLLRGQAGLVLHEHLDRVGVVGVVEAELRRQRRERPMQVREVVLRLLVRVEHARVVGARRLPVRVVRAQPDGALPLRRTDLHQVPANALPLPHSSEPPRPFPRPVRRPASLRTFSAVWRRRRPARRSEPTSENLRKTKEKI